MRFHRHNISWQTAVGFTIGGFIGLLFWETLHVLLALFALPLFGLRCDELTVGFFGFRRVNGRLRKADLPYSWYVKYVPGIDEKSGKNVDIEKAHIRFLLLRILLKTAICAVIIFVTLPDWTLFFNHEYVVDSEAKIAFSIFSWGALINDIIVLVRSSTHNVNGLGGYVQQIKRLLSGGADFSALPMKPPEQLLFEDEPSVHELAEYLTYYCEFLLAGGRWDEMNAPIHKLTDILRSEEFMQNCLPAYAMLVYYYSRFEHDESYANRFYEKAGGALGADTRACSKIALAYYSYGTRGDSQKARYYLNKAKSCADNSASYPQAENMLDRQIIDELDAVLTNEGV